MTMKKSKTRASIVAVAFVLLALCLVFIMPVAAESTSTNKAVIGTNEFETLTAALNSVDANTETTIEIYGTVSAGSGPGQNANKKAIVVGKTTDATVTLVAGEKTFGGCTLTFQNLVISSPGQFPTGLAHTTSLTYKNCVIKGAIYEYANTVVYEDCIFEQTGNDYNIWTYGAGSVTFDRCIFNSCGKSILVYNNGDDSAGKPTGSNPLQQTVTVNDCQFISTGSATEPGSSENNVGGRAAAIEIDSRSITQYTVNINNSTYISNDETKPFSGLVRQKNGEVAAITITNAVIYDADDGTQTTSQEVKYSFTNEQTNTTKLGKPFLFPSSENSVVTELMGCSFTAPSGKEFKAWSIDGQEYAAGATYTFLKDTTVKALWKDVPTYTVTVTANPTEGGTVSASPAKAAAGTDIILTVKANEGYEFKGWEVTSNNVAVIGDNKFTMPVGDVSITAVFGEKKEEPVTPPTEDTPEPVEPSFEDAVETETTEEGVKVTINAEESSVDVSADGRTYFIEDEESGVTLTLFFTEAPSSEDSEDPISGVVEHVSANYNYDAGTNSDSDITDIDVHLSIGLDSPDTPLPKINPEFKEELSQKITEKHSDHTPLAMITAETNVDAINNNLTKKTDRVPLVITFMIDASSLAGIDLTQHKFVGYHISGDSVEIMDARWYEDDGKIIITLNGKHFSSYAVGIAPASSESGEGDDTPSVTPSQRPSSGGSTDTGSGNYNEYPRQADGTAGEISFGSSKDVKAVDLPEGVTGEVKLIAKSTHPAPEGKDTHKVFEINIPNYPTGKAATIKFEMTLADIEAKGLTAADVCLYHFNKETGLWEKLPTTFKVVDGKVYFEAVTTGFSPFAIVFEKGAATPAAGADEPVTPPTETPDVPETPGTLPPVDTPETPEQPTESPAPILAVLAGLGAAAVLRRK